MPQLKFVVATFLFFLIIALAIFHRWFMDANVPCLACEGLLIPSRGVPRPVK